MSRLVIISPCFRNILGAIDMKTFGRISANILVLIIGALLISGCEDSGGGSSNSGHDFGDNNPDVTVAYGDSITYGEG